jgi:hypothetical protein
MLLMHKVPVFLMFQQQHSQLTHLLNVMVFLHLLRQLLESPTRIHTFIWILVLIAQLYGICHAKRQELVSMKQDLVT